MKKILLLFIAVLSLFTIKVKALVGPTREFFVNDYANIISSDVENYIINHSKNLEEKTKAQIVVVTVKNLEGQTLEEYATNLFRKFGIGDKEKNNGLLLLLALEERQFRVEVGYGLEGVLPDGLTGRYQDKYIIPFLKDDKWDEGIKNGYTAFYNKLCNYYGIASNEKVDDTTYKEKSLSNLIGRFPFVSIISLVAGLLLSLSFPFNFKKKKKQKEKKKKKINIAYIIFSWFIFLFFTLPLFLIGISIGWEVIYDDTLRFILVFSQLIIVALNYFFCSFLSSKGIIITTGSYDSSSSSFSGSFGGSDSGGGSSGGGGSSRSF